MIYLVNIHRLMRILLIHSRYSKFGGGENYVSALRALLEMYNHNVFLFSFDTEGCWKNLKEYIYKDNFNINDRNPFKILIFYLLRFYIDPILIIRLRRWIKSINPDIIHIHANDKYGISVLLAIRTLQIPVIQTFHANDAICLSQTFKKQDGAFCLNTIRFSCLLKKCVPISKFLAMAPSYSIRNFLAKQTVTTFIAPNKFLKKRLESNGFKNVVYMPIFVWKNDHSIVPDKGYIFSPGTHLAEKGFQFLIRAMQIIRKCQPFATLHISGKGPYSDILKKITEELNVEKSVIFHGFVENDSLRNQYAQSSLVVFPSLFLEVCPLVILEAMASGRPVVASKFSGIDDEIVKSNVGYFVDPMNPGEIADAVCNILNNPMVADIMGQNGHKLFESRYSPDVHYKNVFALYSSIVD